MSEGKFLNTIAQKGGSPFESIRRMRSDGGEYWSARDLMPLMGYEKWERFEDAIERARVSVENAGHDAGREASRFREPSGSTRQMRTDYHLSRFAAYLVAMNGDPRKAEVAAAQAYFAVQTRKQELAHQSPVGLSRRQILELAMQAEEELGQVRGELAVLAPKASAWDAIVSSAGSWSYQEVAHALLKQKRVVIGQKRLVALLIEWGWLYRDNKKRPHAYQRCLEQGLVTEKLRTYTDKITGETLQSSAPQVRITGKGLDVIYRRLTAASGVVAV